MNNSSNSQESVSSVPAAKAPPEIPPKDDNTNSSSDTETEEQDDAAAIDLTKPVTPTNKIQILEEMINYFTDKDTFPDYRGEGDRKDFCTNWMKIKNSIVELEELRERFKKNYKKFGNKPRGMDKNEEEIYDKSKFIWTKELDEAYGYVYAYDL